VSDRWGASSEAPHHLNISGNHPPTIAPHSKCRTFVRIICLTDVNRPVERAFDP